MLLFVAVKEQILVLLWAKKATGKTCPAWDSNIQIFQKMFGAEAPTELLTAQRKQ